MDAFDHLGLPPVFALEPAALQRAYLARVAALHPDRARPDTADTGDSGAAAAALNHARATLLDPEARANALLARLGGPAKEADRTLPEGFLAEMMTLREAIDGCRAGGDAGAVAAHVAQARARRAAHEARVAALFAAGPVPAALREIRRELNAWRYLERLLEQAE